jgi:hypothetical protein
MIQRNRLVAKLALFSMLPLAAFGTGCAIVLTPDPDSGIRMGTYQKEPNKDKVPVPLVEVSGEVINIIGPGDGDVEFFEDETNSKGLHDEPDARENASWGLTAGPSGWACDELNRQVTIPVGGEGVDMVCDL